MNNDGRLHSNKRSPPRVNRAGFDGAWRLGRASGRGRSGQEPQGNSRRLLAVMRLPEAYCHSTTPRVFLPRRSPQWLATTTQLPMACYNHAAKAYCRDAAPNGLLQPRGQSLRTLRSSQWLVATTQSPTACGDHAAPNGLLQPRDQSLRALHSSQRATSGRPRGGP